jgi:hypothetical protein
VLFVLASALFLGAFLMFVVEPMAARMVLPVLGGAPMVWNTCVVFFQVAVLAGYAGAHAISSRRRGALVVSYIVLLLAAFAVLPMAMPAGGAPVGHSPIPWLLATLVRAIGLPFVVLSMTASVLQRVFADTTHHSARDPYFLYVASNAGSLAGLLAYPLIVEPALGLRAQSLAWTGGYAVFGLLAIAAAVLARPATRTSKPKPSTTAIDAGVSAGRRVRWILLALVPSSLMLSVSTYLSTDIASVPLLWILPLLVYLLTFALAFSSAGPRLHRLVNRRLPLFVVAMAVFMALQIAGAAWFFVPFHLLLLAGVGLLCHGALAADRPPPSHLTEFYFLIAFGGMLGGLFNTLLAPLLFTRILEYPIALSVACAFRRQPDGRPAPRVGRDDVLMAAAVVGSTVLLLAAVQRVGWDGNVAMYLPAFLCFAQSSRPMRFALSVAGLMLAPVLTPGTSRDIDARLLHAERTFFGVYRVTADPANRYHTLFHGTTLHGMEATDPARQGQPLTYYSHTGPFGQAYARLPQAYGGAEIAAVGLGVGSLASYAHPGQRWTFYEIDPAVERIARGDAFSYLRRCGDRCRIVIGDARLSLARATDRFDVIVLDAFNSDAIPIHLMTAEAMALYVDRLTAHGVIAFHISNRYLRLGPVLARIAAEEKLSALEQLDGVGVGSRDDGKRSSHWMLIARNAEDLAPLESDRRWKMPEFERSTPVWRDDFSNILSVMSWR